MTQKYMAANTKNWNSIDFVCAKEYHLAHESSDILANSSQKYILPRNQYLLYMTYVCCPHTMMDTLIFATGFYQGCPTWPYIMSNKDGRRR